MEKKYTIEDVKINSLSDYDKHYRNWHKSGKYIIVDTNCSINISDMFGGCGVQQLYGWKDSSHKSEIKICLQKILSDLHSGTSMLICQVGMNYYDSTFVKALDEFGFEITKEYVNKQHGAGYTQRLYTLIIK